MKNSSSTNFFKPRRIEKRIVLYKQKIEEAIKSFGIHKLKKIWLVKTDESSDGIGSLVYTDFIVKGVDKDDVRNYIKNNFKKQSIISIQNILLNTTILEKFINEIYIENREGKMELLPSRLLDNDYKKFIYGRKKYLEAEQVVFIPVPGKNYEDENIEIYMQEEEVEEYEEINFDENDF